MTEDQFRRIALSLPETTESSHMAHPDFRVGGKVFATLRWPKQGWAMVKLPADQQEMFVSAAPQVFSIVKGAWGKKGATSVALRDAPAAIVRDALIVAWRNRAPRGLVRDFEQRTAR